MNRFARYAIWIMLGVAGISLACGTSAQEPARTELPPRGQPVASPFEGKLLARCSVQNGWSGTAFFNTSRTPFSVLLGARNKWSWVGKSSLVSGREIYQLDTPLEQYASKGTLQGLQVFVVSGDATLNDVVSAEDGLLNYWIYQHQHPAMGKPDIVRLAHDKASDGKPVDIPITQCIIAHAGGPTVTDSCTTPQCPK